MNNVQPFEKQIDYNLKSKRFSLFAHSVIPLLRCLYASTTELLDHIRFLLIFELKRAFEMIG